MTPPNDDRPVAAATAGSDEGLQGTKHRSRPPLKWKRVLAAFVDGRKLNRFDAARELSDHCLHSTVAALQAKGVTILRETERVPGYMGIGTDCRRYWIAPESVALARDLLGRG